MMNGAAGMLAYVALRRGCVDVKVHTGRRQLHMRSFGVGARNADTVDDCTMYVLYNRESFD